jgi:uncharacterized protein involved in exopolysaccharide biosynthesis
MYENDEIMIPGESGSSSRMTIRDFLYVVFRHKWKIIFTFFAVCIVGFTVVSLMPNVYESEGKIQIRTGRDPLTRDSEISMPSADTAPTMDATMRNAIQLLQTPSVAEKVVAAVGADVVLTEPERNSALARFLGRVKERLSRRTGEVSPDPSILNEEMRLAAERQVVGGIVTTVQGNVLTVRYGASDPFVAQKVLQQILDVYKQVQIEVNRPAITPEFFKDEADKAQAALAAKEKELETLRTRHKITAMDAQLTQVTNTIATLKTGMLSASSQISVSEARIRTYQDNLSKQSTSVMVAQPQGENRLVMDLKSQLVQLRIRESDLAKRYPDGALPLENVRSEIAITQKTLEEEQKNSAAVSTAANPARQQTEMALETERANVAGLRASKMSLESELKVAEADLAELRGIEPVVRTLEREVSVLENASLQARRNLTRSLLSATLDNEGISSVKVFQQAVLRTAPVGPNRKRNYAVVLFLAVLGSLGLALALEYLNQSLKTPEDVEKHLGLPVLATLSYKEFKSCI